MSVPPPYIDELPKHFYSLLSTAEKQEFDKLYKQIHQKLRKTQTVTSIISIKEDFRNIDNFITYGPAETKDARAICCGLFFTRNSILINTKQAKVLLGRSKSSVNTSLQHMGYNSGRNGVKRTIVICIPSLSKFPEIARQWTIRSLDSKGANGNTVNESNQTVISRKPKAILLEPTLCDDPNKGKDPQKYKIPQFYYSKNEFVYNICLPHSSQHYVTYTFRHYFPHISYSENDLFTSPKLEF